MSATGKSESRQQSTFTRRALLLGGLQAAGFSALGARLWQLQVQDGSRYALLADDNRINLQLLAPERGQIFDRYGTLLAGNIEGYRALLQPSFASDIRTALERFSEIVPLSNDEIDKLVLRARRQPPHMPLVIAQDLDFNTMAAINVRAPQLPGISTEAAPRRRYHGGAAMGHVLGYVGAHTSAAMDDDPLLRLPGARVGLAGIERGRETTLRGKAGLVQSEVDSRGRIVRHLDRVEPLRGADLAITIDATLQADVMQKLAPYRRAAAVVMAVSTGEVLALASNPAFDPNDVLDGTVNRRGWNRLRTALDDPMNSRAARGVYPPGSTFKIVTALAALEAGVVTLKERIGCDGRYDFYDQTFRCWKRSGHGLCDMHRAIKESCDCYFYEIARRTGIDAIAATARKLGLGQLYDCGLANLKSGLVPDPDWKRGRFNKSWYAGETLIAGIGQGYVLATPLQLAVMTARVAAGRAVTPTFVKPNPDEPLLAVPELALKAEHLAAVRRGLVAVVNEDGGTGSRAQPDDDSIKVAGKTGTSQVSRHSTEAGQSELAYELRDHALFVCYFPANAPRYAIATVVEHGGGGGATAAPLARDMIEAVMERESDVAAFEKAARDRAATTSDAARRRNDG